MYENVLIKPGQHTLTHTHIDDGTAALDRSSCARSPHSPVFFNGIFSYFSRSCAEIVRHARARTTSRALAKATMTMRVLPARGGGGGVCGEGGMGAPFAWDSKEGEGGISMIVYAHMSVSKFIYCTALSCSNAQRAPHNFIENNCLRIRRVAATTSC